MSAIGIAGMDRLIKANVIAIAFFLFQIHQARRRIATGVVGYFIKTGSAEPRAIGSFEFHFASANHKQVSTTQAIGCMCAEIFIVVIAYASGNKDILQMIALIFKIVTILIALMIVMSATLPSFLSTSLALDVANTETDRRLSGGAAFRISPPAEVQSVQRFGPPQPGVPGVFRQELLAEVKGEPGFAETVELTKSRSSKASDGAGVEKSKQPSNFSYETGKVRRANVKRDL